MVYTRDQPADVDVGISRSILAANTNQADTSFGIDHVKFSVATNVGYHHFLHFDQIDDGATDITAPTGNITNIFATETLATTTKPLPVFRNATGVGFLVPVGAMISFPGSNSTSYPVSLTPIGMYVNATVVKTSSTLYTITFDKAFNNVNYHVQMTSSAGATITTKAIGSLTIASAGATSTSVLSFMIYDVISSLT